MHPFFAAAVWDVRFEALSKDSARLESVGCRPGGAWGAMTQRTIMAEFEEFVPPKHWILLRGLGRESRHWFDFPRSFAQALGCEVHVMDLPGAGRELRRTTPLRIQGISDDVEERLPFGQKTEFAVLGLSLGGMVALQLASASRWCRRVVLVNSSSALSKPTARFQPSALPMLMSSIVRGDVLTRERQIYWNTTRLRRGSYREFAAEAETFYRTAPVRRTTVCNQLIAAGRFRPPKVDVPALVLSSRADQLVKPECSSVIAGWLGVEHYQHPAAGHDLTLDDPEWVSARIADWLRLPARRTIHN